jgi:hypothetical protein
MTLQEVTRVTNGWCKRIKRICELTIVTGISSVRIGGGGVQVISQVFAPSSPLRDSQRRGVYVVSGYTHDLYPESEVSEGQAFENPRNWAGER